ncbi:hypothetical protein DSL72_002652 [Monilinia vaccinii-corymbosi]|uniref:SCP2 domain-containing protein n=1 Tax=Monilinia vaccinii-corymbosi TaxID=61207 RepID=A0A8A3PD36_9HELO|nr:hypothetical protein DSL72_002652 [Monilinia vaccinii-corymbosi]
MSLKNDAFPSSAAFDAISASLSSSPAARAAALKQGKGIFAFTLKNKGGETATWHLDLKDAGTVGTGPGANPAVTLSLSDEDFGKLVQGKANAQRLFMAGKLKVKGDAMKAMKLGPILEGARGGGDAGVKAKL